MFRKSGEKGSEMREWIPKRDEWKSKGLGRKGLLEWRKKIDVQKSDLVMDSKSVSPKLVTYSFNSHKTIPSLCLSVLISIILISCLSILTQRFYFRSTLFSF